MVVVSFLILIAAGALLLALPAASRSGSTIGFVDSLFTATSAVCVSGITVADTFETWNIFGQLVILFLIQVGGLGLVTFVVFFGVSISRKIGIRNMQLAREAVGFGSSFDAATLVKLIVKVSLGIELCGACLLLLRFIPEFGVGMGMYISSFLAVSAFCNAGFDVLPHSSGESLGLLNYNSDPIVLPVLSILVILGGLGFVVWYDILFNKRQRALMMHTKVVLVITALLLFIGMSSVLLFEWDNEKTLKNLPLLGKINSAFFQSATLRTAGFFSLNPAGFTGITKLIAICLMCIGGAPGSTASGIKVTTLAVIWKTISCFVKGQNETIIGGKRVSKQLVYKAISTFGIALFAVAVSSSVVCYATRNQNVSGLDVVFDSVAAINTVGLSAGAVDIAQAGWMLKLIFGLFMFIGRVGPVSLMFAFLREPPEKGVVLPDAQIMIG
ncbi:potassium uptake protein, TrkH family [Clostridia bacterium]|nr:potassium uptake protein, TrkH family [Clostridia bacterium]